MASTKKWLSAIFLATRFKWVGFDNLLWEGSTDVVLWEDGYLVEGENRDRRLLRARGAAERGGGTD